MELDATTHEGSCHCGAVRYRARVDLNQVISCNCSMCGRAGTILGFSPASAFELLSGEEALRDYQFGAKNIHHLFCATCGIRPFGRGTDPQGNEMVAINVRCLEGVDPKDLRPTPVDGKSF